jgi:hypothetical protein
MMQDKQWCRVLPLSLLVFMLLPPSLTMGGQNITASWTNHQSKDNVSEDNYSLTYNLDLQQEITEAMSMQESFRSSNGWGEESDNHSIDPSLRFTINNDLFLLELYGSGHQRQSSNAATQEQTNGEAVWSSTWDRRFWPNLRTSFGTDWQEDNASPKRTDNTTITESLAFDWDLEFFKVYYNFNRKQFSDDVTDRENNNTNNFARLEARHSFLENRINFGFSHQYSETKDTVTSNIGGSGVSLIQQSLSQVLHGLDATPLLTAGELTPAPTLHDGDLITASSVSTDGTEAEPHNIGLKVDFKTIHMIYLYTTTDQSANNAGFTFDLYTSDNGTNWQLSTTSQPFSYNSTEKRFEFPVSGLRNLWLKLVITSSPIVTVDFSEIETYQSVTSAGKLDLSSTSSSSITDLNLGFMVTDTFSVSYSFSMDKGQYGSGVDYSRHNQTGNLKWQPQPNLSTTVMLNETTQQNGDAEESKTRSYALNMNTIPIDTININMGLSQTERFEAATRQSVGYNVGMLTTAALYPDLDASLDLNYSHTTQDSTNLTTSNYNTNLTLTARLVPSLTANLNTGYQQDLERNGDNTTDTTLSLNWRTSDMMSIHLTGNKNWVNSQSESEGASLSMALAPTDTTQFSFTYTYVNANQIINKYSLFGSWSLGPHFTLQSNGSYSESQTQQEWQVQTQLVARFSVL